MRMRGVENDISPRRARFGICQPEVRVVPGAVAAAEGRGGGGGVRRWVSGMSVVLSHHFKMRVLFFSLSFFPILLLQLLFARITNRSLQRLLLTSSSLLITFGDAKLVN